VRVDDGSFFCAGFTLALFGKNVGPIFPAWKKLAPFLVITVAFIHFTRSSFTRVSPIISGMQKIAAPLVGAPILWGPCSAEHA